MRVRRAQNSWRGKLKQTRDKELGLATTSQLVSVTIGCGIETWLSGPWRVTFKQVGMLNNVRVAVVVI